jgi:hypothetical protein
MGSGLSSCGNLCSDGVIYREQLGEPDDIQLPKFGQLQRMNYGEFLSAVSQGETRTVELWRDKEPYWFPPWRQYFDGQRAVVTLNSGVRDQRTDTPHALARFISLRRAGWARSGVGPCLQSSLAAPARPIFTRFYGIPPAPNRPGIHTTTLLPRLC